MNIFYLMVKLFRSIFGRYREIPLQNFKYNEEVIVSMIEFAE